MKVKKIFGLLFLLSIYFVNHDATAHARFQSNHEALASVDADGLVTTRETAGDVAIMASYLDSVDVFRALIPRPGGSEGNAGPILAVGGLVVCAGVCAHVTSRWRKLVGSRLGIVGTDKQTLARNARA